MLLFEHFVAPSPINGLGVFTRAALPKGTLIWRFDPSMDREFPLREVSQLSAPLREWILQRAEYCPNTDTLVIASDGDLFMNHSDNPNLSSTGHECWALRDIEAGEEVTCDYRTTVVLGFQPAASGDEVAA